MILHDKEIRSLIFSGLIICLIFGISNITSANSQEEGLILEIVFSPSAIEAGEGVYSIGYVYLVNEDGNPLLAPDDMIIELISEDPSLVSVPEEVVIPLNRHYAQFDIEVTDLEGTTEIVAIHGNEVATTKFSVGGLILEVPVETELALNIPVSEMHINTEMPIAVFLDNNGTVVQAPKDITVSFEFEKSLLSMVDDEIVIEKGNFFATTAVKTHEEVGRAFIRAITQEPSLDTAQSLTISSSLPSKLQVNVFPPMYVQLEDREVDFFVSLLDADDNPVLATENVPLELFSNVVTLDNKLEDDFRNKQPIIKRGEWGFYYKIKNIILQDIDRRAFIGASSPGYGLDQGRFDILPILEESSFLATNQTITSYIMPEMPSDATAIMVYEVSAIKWSDDDQDAIDAAILAGTADEHPFNFETDIFEEDDTYPISVDFDDFDTEEREGLVNSSDLDLVKIVDPGKMDNARTFATAVIQSGRLATGEVDISVALKGVGSATNSTTIVNVLNPVSTLIFSPTAEKIVFNDAGISELFVITLDEIGRPANTQEGVKYLVEPINEILNISPKTSYDKIQFHTSLFAKELLTGNAGVYANPIGTESLSDLQSADVFSIAPSSSTTTVLLPFDIIVGNEDQVHTFGTVQLVDFFGNPVVVQEPLIVGLVHTDFLQGEGEDSDVRTQVEAIEIPTSVVIPKGSSSTTFDITALTTDGTAEIMPVVKGFLGQNATLNLVEFAKELELFPPSAGTAEYTVATEMTLFVDDNYGISVNGALITLSAVNATVLPKSGTTNEAGEFSFLYTPQNATATLTIDATKKGYSSDSYETNVIVTNVPVPKQTLFGLPPFVMYIAIGGMVGVVAIVGLKIMRKPKVKTEEEIFDEI